MASTSPTIATSTDTTRCRGTASLSHHAPSSNTHTGCTWNSTTATPVCTCWIAVKNSHQLASISPLSSNTHGKAAQPTQSPRHSPDHDRWRHAIHNVSPTRPKAQRNQVTVNGAACASCTNTPMEPSSALPSKKAIQPSSRWADDCPRALPAGETDAGTTGTDVPETVEDG